jgi:hypothetical protein
MSETIGFIETALSERRSIERAFADLIAEHDRSPRPDLARMIRGLRTEIMQRKRCGEFKTIGGRLSTV